MLLDTIFAPFVKERPICVMARAVLERLLDAPRLDAHAQDGWPFCPWPGPWRLPWLRVGLSTPRPDDAECPTRGKRLSAPVASALVGAKRGPRPGTVSHCSSDGGWGRRFGTGCASLWRWGRRPSKPLRRLGTASPWGASASPGVSACGVRACIRWPLQRAPG